MLIFCIHSFNYFLLLSLLSLFEQNPFLILVVLLISCGLFMFTFESTQFNLEGFIMVLLASFIGGIRWTLTQVLMQKAELGQYSVTYVQQSCCTCFASEHFSHIITKKMLTFFLCNLFSRPSEPSRRHIPSPTSHVPWPLSPLPV